LPGSARFHYLDMACLHGQRSILQYVTRLGAYQLPVLVMTRQQPKFSLCCQSSALGMRRRPCRPSFSVTHRNKSYPAGNALWLVRLCNGQSNARGAVTWPCFHKSGPVRLALEWLLEGTPSPGVGAWHARPATASSVPRCES